MLNIAFKVPSIFGGKPASSNTVKKTRGVFHLPKTFGNFHGKVHRVKNAFHLTQVPFDCALVTKIQDGGTDIALNSLELVIPCETS